MVDKLLEECDKIVAETILVKINSTKRKYNSCIVYIVLFSIIITFNVGIVIYYVYSQWYLKKYSPHDNFNTYKETII